MIEYLRRKTPKIKVGITEIGGDAPISVQSMCNTDSHDVEATYKQIIALQNAGCDIVRLAIPDLEAASSISELKRRGVSIPLVADIHFDYRIALAAVKAGVDKVRINPGNIGDSNKVRTVADACKDAGIPIRIGVNSGSLEKSILQKYGRPSAEALAESALYHASLLEEQDFHNIIISVKASNVPDMILANRILAEKTSYPLHLGVTEAGGIGMGTVKGNIGIGTLLAEGIGDTVRVSLTADPVLEIKAARNILTALNLNIQKEMNIVSCPTCGRTKIDLFTLLHDFEAAIDKENLRQKPLTVALMGCVVNGPGEAREADIGIAGGKDEAVIFRKGEIIAKTAAKDIIPRLIEEIKRF